MAKKRGSDKLGVFLTLIFLGVIFYCIAVPIYLLYGCFRYSFKLKGISPAINGNESDFWLTSAEKSKFKNISSKLLEAIEKVQNAESLGLDSNISRNMDGRFSARSKLGREIRNIIDQLTPQIDQWSQTYRELSNLPRLRWAKFAFTLSRAKSFQYGLGGWILLILVSVGFRNQLSQMSFLQETPDLLYLVISLIGAIGGTFCYMFGKVHGKNIVGKVSPCPPEVALNNVDCY